MPDRIRLKGFTFLSLKPILAVVNVDEDEVERRPLRRSSGGVDGWPHRAPVAPASRATLEREIAELDPADAAAFMAELGIADRALDRVAREAYRLLGLISFFTVGEDECRAWSIPQETPAVEAARVDPLRHLEGLHPRRGGAARRAVVHRVARRRAATRGTLRLEGKTYPVRDGDVVHYRFNV